MSIIFDEGQEKALDIMYKKYKAGQQEIVLSGISGSGKSTIIKTLTEDMLGLKNACYGAYTGRAAKVLRIKGLPALTLHKLLYKAVVYHGRVHFVLRNKEEFEQFDTIIIDEISMVPQKMLDDLRAVSIRIIAMGDPFQLDAIGKANTLLKKPDAELLNPHRQSLENPIYYWANEIRTKGRMPNLGLHGDSMFVVSSFRELPDAHKQNAEIIICGTNRTRVAINNSMRDFENHSGILVPNDKIIFLKNEWESLSSIESPIVNGGRGIVHSVGIPSIKVVEKFDQKTKRMICTSIDVIPAKVECLEEGGYWDVFLPIDVFGKEKVDEFANTNGKETIAYADYGSCITTYKSQGSEWEKGIYINETFGDAVNRLRQTYTGMTRFKEKLIFALNY